MDPIYGEMQQKPKKKRGCLIAVLVVLALSLISAVFRSCGGSREQLPEKPADSVTEEQPAATEQTAATSATKRSTTVRTTASAAETSRTTTASTAAETTQAPAVIDPDFKAWVDSYEAFIDSYIAFMQRYSTSDDTLSMMNEYLEYMQKYNDFVTKAASLDESKMNAAESAYYLEVTLRIEQKLLKASLT